MLKFMNCFMETSHELLRTHMKFDAIKDHVYTSIYKFYTYIHIYYIPWIHKLVR
jgi:hypothetical protein